MPVISGDHALHQAKLRNAAKARIIRWVKPKSRRKDLEAPDFVKDQWANGNKNAMGDLFAKVNFQQEMEPKTCPNPYVNFYMYVSWIQYLYSIYIQFSILISVQDGSSSLETKPI